MKNMVKGALCAIMILSLIAMCACGPQKPYKTSFKAMDTVMSLTVYGDGDVSDELKDKISELDSLLDTTNSESDISRLNAEKTASVNSETAELLERSVSLCQRLEGYFDITVYPAVLEWGFTRDEYRVPDEKRLKELSAVIDYRSISRDGDAYTLSGSAMIDLGAVAKGYAADECLDILRQSEAQGAVLNLGGTIGLYGKKPDGSMFRVGVADPKNPAGYFGYLELSGGVISTSGGYERYFVADDGTTYIHILDPETARPVDNGIQSVTVVCDSGTNADALSTALFVMGLDKAVRYRSDNGGFDFIILKDDDLYITDGIYDSFILAEGFGFELHKV